MTETTQHRDLAAILADLDCPPSPYGTGGEFYRELELAVRAQLAPLPEGEADRLAEAAERDARTMAPPVPGVTANAGYTIRAVLPGHPASDGLLASWYVACEAESISGAWVTWTAYALDHPGREGYLSYDAGHYYDGPDPADNRDRALSDLAIRAGLMSGVGLRIAEEVTRYHDLTAPFTTGQAEDRRMAARLRKWCGR